MNIQMIKRTAVYSTATVGLLLLAACGGGGSGSSTGGTTGGNFSGGGATTARVAIENYVNDVVLDILGRLDLQAGNLLSAVESFQSSPDAAALLRAREAWIMTRVPWEESETALFGPVDFRGFDPALDSWPVNRVDLQGVLDSSIALNDSTVAALDPALKGYHTIEFLLYGEGGAKQATDFTDREFAYLVSATRDLRNVASLLLQSWTVGISGSGPYAEEFVSAGQGSSIYPSEEAALEEMLRGMITICDEVANGKIADPFDTRNTELVESQFSYNSITDFTSNVRGVKFAYDRGLSSYVAEIDSALDARVKNQIDQAIAALGAIPEPFRAAILDS
ncbi:MAG: hypothetical protein KDD42_06810, partial [Bdellovibrionales bacterium]|nr:hypothetical protein [Bdellovibrionales bacterium]